MTQREALDILKTGANVFLTGEPGSGKTHTINEYVKYLRGLGIEPAVTASTGIAATHIGGMTIHSWSGIGIKTSLNSYELDKLASSEYLAKRIRRAKVLIIDEISMLSAGTLSLVETVCRTVRQNSEPFGGIQVVFVGDFFQLPPIVRTDRESLPVGRFAYDSLAWAEARLMVCYLTEQHRQDDADFLALLSAIRQNSFGEDHFQHIEARKIKYSEAPDNVPKLFSHNIDVDHVNDTTLSKISGPAKTFQMTSHGAANLKASLQKGCLSPEILTLKVGASVMFTKNSPRGGFVNGTLGTVVSFSGATGYPLVRTREGRKIEASPLDWMVEEGGVVRARITQVPLRLAWAITVHKSQGMSLDAAIMDLSSVFEFGQGYVALSRVKRLSGLHMLGWNARAFQVHPEILTKDEFFRLAAEDVGEAFSGIDREKLIKMHENFAKACGGNLKKGMEDKKVKEGFGKKSAKTNASTYEETLVLFNLGISILEIATKRKLTETTIISHIEKLFKNNKISKKEIEKIIPVPVRVAQTEIEKEFKKGGDGKLSPVFEKFKGKYPYEDLRLVRLLL